MTRTDSPALICLIWAPALIASGIAPYDRLTWFMEVLPVLIAAPMPGGYPWPRCR